MLGKACTPSNEVYYTTTGLKGNRAAVSIRIHVAVYEPDTYEKQQLVVSRANQTPPQKEDQDGKVHIENVQVEKKRILEEIYTQGLTVTGTVSLKNILTS